MRSWMAGVMEYCFVMCMIHMRSFIVGRRFDIGVDNYGATQKYLQEHEEESREYWEGYVARITQRGDLSGLLKEECRGIRLNTYKQVLDERERRLEVKEELYKGLKEFVSREGVTINAVLQFAWHKILKVYGNSNQTVVGTTVSGRNILVDGIEESVGLYINTLPLMVEHQSDEEVLGSIIKIQEEINEFNSRSIVNLAKLQVGGERLFDSLFIYENYPTVSDEKQEARLKIKFRGAMRN